ncbi:MAG: ABC transporter permease [Chitinophagales bacterium]
MGKYILKRILFFIPTLVVISLLAFIISIQAPGDPLDRLVSVSTGGDEQSAQSITAAREKDRWRKKLGLDLPVFYFSVTNAATPDTLYRYYDRREQETLKRLIHTYGDWKEIDAYNKSLHRLSDLLNLCSAELRKDTVISDAADKIQKCKNVAAAMLYLYEPERIQAQLDTLMQYAGEISAFPEIKNTVRTSHDAFGQLLENKSSWLSYIPVIHFYGYNQYHRWIFGDGNWLTGKGSTHCRGILRGDFGYSYETKLPVSSVIGERIRWSLLFTLISIILAYIISIPVGIRAAAKKDSLFDRTSSVILFILYSMPSFWVATLLLMTFSNPDMLHWFPASGVQPVTGIPEGTSFFARIRMHLPYMVLPTICYTYAQLAFLSRLTRVSTLDAITQDFVRTARAKGLSEKAVIYKHAFRNALLPVITVFANVFPLAIGGSVILETIFTIPGMGQQIFQAITTKDYPVIIDVFTLTGVLTLIGYLFADILYAWADPRISFHTKRG